MALARVASPESTILKQFKLAFMMANKFPDFGRSA